MADDDFIGFGHEEKEENPFVGFGNEDPEYKAEVKKVKKKKIIFKKLKKKEETEEAEEEKAAEPKKGILDRLKGGYGKAKGYYGTAKGYYGAGKGYVTKGKSWIYAILLIIVSSSIGFLSGFGWYGILIGLIIAGLIFKRTRKLTLALLLIGGIILVLYLFIYGGGGFYSTWAGTYVTQLKEKFKPVTTQLGITKMMLSGEYDPSELWTSKVYKDRYAQEVGVEVYDVKPLRDYFSTSEKAIIIGTVKVNALSENPDKDPEGILVDISAKDGGDWDCDPDSAADTLQIKSTERFFGRFQCISKDFLKISDITGQNTMESKEVDVTVKLNAFETIAGKSTYVVDYNTLNLLYLEDQDPMAYYQLKSDQIASWQSKSPINLGLGILGEKNIIAANEDKNKAPYYLGITMRNMGTGNLFAIDDLVVEIPQSITFMPSEENDFEPVKNGCENLGTLALCKYRLKDISSYNENGPKLCGAGEFMDCKIGPGEYKTVYLKFKASKEDFLGDANIKEFFALADMSFDYEDVTKVAIQVKEL